MAADTLVTMNWIRGESWTNVLGLFACFGQLKLQTLYPVIFNVISCSSKVKNSLYKDECTIKKMTFSALTHDKNPSFSKVA